LIRCHPSLIGRAFDVALSIVNEISDTVFIFTALIRTSLFLYGKSDILLDHFSRVSQLRQSTRTGDILRNHAIGLMTN